ncbi:hypothetical protein ILYODFUR_013658 [Ilyodon furcidens]|uniref:Uncharacterized protein n=1 Tax=Ilyodon furcidens TaxID=33524 RepID=A0ABV0TVJ8_9TELE
MVSKPGSVGYAIIGKTANWTDVQKSCGGCPEVMDILHKEGKPQKVIPKEASCSQSAVSKRIHRKLSGRKSDTWATSLLPGLRRKITGLFLSGLKSSFQMKVKFAFHLEIKVPESGRRVEKHRIHTARSPV